MISLLSKLALAGIAAAAVAIPPLHSRVTDLTSTLNASQKEALEKTLSEFEARKGAQIAVLVLPSTQPETIEQYAVRVEEQWKLGRKGVDDSVLLLVAIQDRKVRLEVGYGLEGVLPDAAAKRIIEDNITPRFRQGDFYGGIRAGLDRVMRTVEGEPLPPPPAASATPAQQHGIEEYFFPLFIFFVIGGGVLKSLFGRFLGGGLVGGAIGLAIWLFVGSLVLALFIGFVAFLLAALTGVPTGRGGRGSSGWGGGGWSSGGGGWSSGSSGGGFSGGGGSSGGGGASGSW